MVSGEMTIITEEFHFSTDGEEIDLIDLTQKIREFISSTKISEGRVTVFVPGSTGAIFATEFEPRLNKDTKRVIAEVIKRGDNYEHDKIDNNAHSHLRTSFLGSEMTIPVIGGRPTLGTWQQIVFGDMDTRPRNRTVIFQMIGIKHN